MHQNLKHSLFDFLQPLPILGFAGRDDVLNKIKEKRSWCLGEKKVMLSSEYHEGVFANITKIAISKPLTSFLSPLSS